MAQPDLKQLKKTLRSQFQLRELKPGQQEVIQSVLSGRNTLAILPTGGGKSLCYQLPALHLDGVTVIVSPLISLMKDQKEKSQDLGMEAVEFNSTVAAKDQKANLERLDDSENQFIYTTPEKLENPEFLEKLRKTKIDFVVIDEAHCVSQWGHDFRPAYLNLSQALKALGNPPVLALTATATPEVVDDIQEQLKLKDLQVFRTNLMRENLELKAELFEKEEEKKERLLKYLHEKVGSGIVYASTVKNVENLYEFLRSNGIPCLRYHGKLKPSERGQNQDLFMTSKDPMVMVATNAFGMGIDKPDIRYVVHYNFPGSLEAYYQEAGRGGRDGKPAECLLFYLKKDKATQSLFLARKYPSLDELSKLYAAIVELGQGRTQVSREELSRRLSDLPPRKLSLLISFLKHLEIIREKKRGSLNVPRMNLTAADISALAERYEQRQEGDQRKLKQVVIYAQTALCRWKLITQYFGEEVDWVRCSHCDNCRQGTASDLLLQ